MFEPFQNPNVASQFFPEWLCQNWIKPTHFQKYFRKNQLNLIFSKKCGFWSWRGSNIQTLFYIKPNPLKLCLSGTIFVGYATNGHLVSLRDWNRSFGKGRSWLLTVLWRYSPEDEKWKNSWVADLTVLAVCELTLQTAAPPCVWRRFASVVTNSAGVKQQQQTNVSLGGE
jgi:hypothetical protein